MKKRILSLALAFLFVFTLTAPVSAIIDVYDEVSITFRLPKEGQSFPDASSFVPTHGAAKSVTWHHVNWSALYPGEKVGNDGYYFTLTVELEEGYDWGWNSTTNEADVTVKLIDANGNTHESTNVSTDERKLTVIAYVEAEPKKPEMDSVEILPLGNWKPVPGAKPDFQNYLITNGKAGFTVRWYDLTDDEELGTDDTFADGHRYRISFYILPDPAAEWKEASHGYADVKAVFYTEYEKLTAESPQLSYDYNGTKLLVSFFFDCEAGVSNVTIEAKGAWYPVHGQKPVDLGAFTLLTEECSYATAGWYDEAKGRFMAPNETFVGEQTYSLVFNIHLVEDYTWAAADQIKVLLENEGGDGWQNQTPVTFTDYGTVAVVKFPFKAVKESLPEKLVIKGVKAPTEGKPFQFDGLDINGYSEYSIVWYDVGEDDLIEAGQNVVAKKGHVYSIIVKIWPPAGNEWPYTTDKNHNDILNLPVEMVLSDGKKAEPISKIVGGYEDLHTTRAAHVGYTFPPVGGTPSAPLIVFLTEPADLTAAEGSTVSFSVQIKGESKSVQWYEVKPDGSASKLKDGANVSGATTETLTLKDIKADRNGYGYRCVAADAYGTEITSRAGILSVTKKSTIVFKDVPESEWYYSWVYDAVDLGLINGKGKDTDGKDYFDPKGEMTFAQAAKLAACMHELSTTGKITLQNGEKNWYDSYIEYCRDKGILLKSGEQGGITWEAASKHADDAVTRKEFAWIFARALKPENLAVKNNIPDGSVPDVKDMTSVWYAGIYTLYRAGILNGSDEKGTFNPEAYISRAEVSAIVVRMMTPARRVDAPKNLGA